MWFCSHKSFYFYISLANVFIIQDGEIYGVSERMNI